MPGYFGGFDERASLHRPGWAYPPGQYGLWYWAAGQIDSGQHHTERLRGHRASRDSESVFRQCVQGAGVMGRDLGTYHVRVELSAGGGWIALWTTAGHYTCGTLDCKPLTAQWIPPIWDTEEEVLDGIRYQYLEGNESCDCNKLMSLARSLQQADLIETPCGDTVTIQRLTVRCPDGR